MVMGMFKCNVNAFNGHPVIQDAIRYLIDFIFIKCNI